MARVIGNPLQQLTADTKYMRNEVSTHIAHQGGFTLVELLVTIAIAAILVSLAAPSFQTMLLNNRMAGQTDELTNALNYARNTALSQSVGVIVCPIGAVSSTTCGTDWGAGWVVVSDPSGTPTLIQSRLTVAGSPVVSSTANVTFDARGLSTTQSNFTICDSRGTTFGRSVQVVATGSVQAGNTPGTAVWGTPALFCP